jgi:pyruvate,orthophosphate dikinase
VVGAADVEVADDAITIGGTRIAVGETITIDGGTGEVFAGAVGGERTVVPEEATLMAWARDLGIAIGEEAALEAGAEGTAGSRGPAGASSAAESAPAAAREATAGSVGVDTDVVIRALLVRGYRSPADLAVALLSTPEALTDLLDRLAADGLVEISAGAFRLSADGKTVAEGLMAEDSDRWGLDAANAALDAFLALDGRMKETVTAWQMRDVDGTQTFNDHSDAAYDARVLGDLAALHADVSAWLTPLAAGLPRLATYGTRLDRAARLAADGDPKYVASPRVDSYHGAWFELHEDLILLAGRTRADEVAAGRA